MSVKIRLTRQGKKKFAYYHIVIADSRAPRAGRFVEKIGIYDPNTDPATINISFDKAMEWLDKGAQPTETVRAILSYKGILMRRHLMGGVKKGAFTEEEANRRFDEWMKQKEGKIEAKRERISMEKEEYVKEHLAQESKVKELRAQEILKKISKLAEKEEAVTEGGQAEAESQVTETPVSEVTAETTEEKESGNEAEKPEQSTQEQMTDAEQPSPEPAEVENREKGQPAEEEKEGQEVDSESEGKEPAENPEELKEEKSE
jgi:small subunit ribosomal protein S16